MMPARWSNGHANGNAGGNAGIELRLHQEHVIGLVKA